MQVPQILPQIVSLAVCDYADLARTSSNEVLSFWCSSCPFCSLYGLSLNYFVTIWAIFLMDNLEFRWAFSSSSWMVTYLYILYICVKDVWQFFQINWHMLSLLQNLRCKRKQQQHDEKSFFRKVPFHSCSSKAILGTHLTLIPLSRYFFLFLIDIFKFCLKSWYDDINNHLLLYT